MIHKNTRNKDIGKNQKEQAHKKGKHQKEQAHKT